MTYANIVSAFGVSAIMLLISLFKPNFALPFCKKRWVAMLFWICAVALSGIIMRDMRPNDHNIPVDQRYQADLERVKQIPVSAELTPLTQEALSSELLALLYELDELRQLKSFHEQRFNGLLPQAMNWEAKVNNLRASAHNNPNIPESLQNIPYAMLHLAIEWAHNMGQESDVSKELLGKIRGELKR